MDIFREGSQKNSGEEAMEFLAGMSLSLASVGAKGGICSAVKEAEGEMRFQRLVARSSGDSN